MGATRTSGGQDRSPSRLLKFNAAKPAASSHGILTPGWLAFSPTGIMGFSALLPNYWQKDLFPLPVKATDSNRSKRITLTTKLYIAKGRRVPRNPHGIPFQSPSRSNFVRMADESPRPEIFLPGSFRGFCLTATLWAHYFSFLKRSFCFCYVYLCVSVCFCLRT